MEITELQDMKYLAQSVTDNNAASEPKGFHGDYYTKVSLIIAQPLGNQKSSMEIIKPRCH